MNDLDKRIAKLKGWREPTMDERKAMVEADGAHRTPLNLPLYFLVPLDHPATPPWSVMDMTECKWSSDAKAFDLVDELIQINHGIGINITRERQTGRWMVSICPDNWVHGEGPSRPEAICRAYIAAREWMATKAKEDEWRKGEEAKDKAMRSELGL